MRIRSRFHDYYDDAMALGQDMSLLYVREQERFNLKEASPEQRKGTEFFTSFAHDVTHGGFELRNARKVVFQVTHGLLLLAGRLYPYVRLSHCDPARLGAREEHVSYTLEDLQHYAQRMQLPADCFEARSTETGRWWDTRNTSTLGTFLALQGDERLHAQAVEHGVVAVLYEDVDYSVRPVCINPQLAELQFYRVMDAWQAFQTIQSFLGNLAAPDKVPVKVADKDRIVQHGFDKWSFRKRPQKQ